MHLGLLTTSYPRDEDDYAGRFVRRSAQRWVARGYRVTVVAPRTDRPDHIRPRDKNITLIEAPTPRGIFYGDGAPEQLMRVPSRALKIPHAVAALYWTGRRALADCDALIGHWLLPSGVLCAWLAGGRPYSVMVHSGGAHLMLRSPRRFQRWIAAQLRDATSVLSSSPPMAATLTARLGRAVTWQLPVAETSALLDLPAPRFEPPIVLGFLGRRVPVKGLDVLIDAATLARRRGAPIRLLIAGPGPAAPTHDWIEDLGELRGGAALRDFFSRIDALIVPSRLVEGGRTEGLPCVIQESLAAARPVIASDVGGIRALLPPDACVPPGDVEALASRIECLVSGSR